MGCEGLIAFFSNSFSFQLCMLCCALALLVCYWFLPRMHSAERENMASYTRSSDCLSIDQ
jgi:hypothetical protein